jgi:hypothetical protein
MRSRYFAFSISLAECVFFVESGGKFDLRPVAPGKN